MDVITIEETNKVRVAVGLKPLSMPGDATTASASGPSFKEARPDFSSANHEPASTLESRTAAASDNWQRLQAEKEAKEKREATKAAIKKAREKAERFKLLKGKGLADGEDDIDDRTWIMQEKKRKKKIDKARKMQEELEERERQAQAALQYTEADLAGVKVGHELGAFDEGEDQVLVLKDTAIDEEEDDELEVVALKEKEKLAERLDSKKRKRAYDPNDIDESGQHSLLAQYDDEIDGKKRKAFTLNGQGRTVEDMQAEAAGALKPKKIAFSLDVLKEDTPMNDYKDISEVKVRKPKKKKSKSSRRRHVEEQDDIFQEDDAAREDDMDVDEPKASLKSKKSGFDEPFVDDDDLQATLAAQRRAALKKRKKMRPEDLARQLREEEPATPDVLETIEEPEELEEPGLVIDETTEFVSSLQKPAEPTERQRHKSSQPADGTISMGRVKSVDLEGDIDMKESYNQVDERKEREQGSRSASIDVNNTGLEDEAALDKGLGATLKLLKQRGMVDDVDQADLNANFRARQKFLADKQKAEEAAERLAREQRERDRMSGRFSHMAPREREDQARRINAQRDQVESRKLAEIFNKEYKPDVQLNYVDDHGRHMNAKEAFKHLSHQFHGKGSGNQKTQKHLDRIASEKRKMAESSLDTSQAVGGMRNAQGQQSKKQKQPGVRLQ